MARVHSVFFILSLTVPLASAVFNPLNQCSGFTGKVTKCSAKLAVSLASDPTMMSGLRDVAFGSAGSTTLSETVIDAICDNKDSVTKFYSCMYRELATCLSADTMKYFPNNTKLSKGISFFCDNLKDVNFTCILSRSARLTSCVGTAVAAVTKDTDFTNIKSVLRYACSVSSKSLSCYSIAYYGCGNSADIVKQYFDLIKPAACKGGIAMSSPLVLMLALLLIFYRATQDIL